MTPMARYSHWYGERSTGEVTLYVCAQCKQTNAPTPTNPVGRVAVTCGACRAVGRPETSNRTEWTGDRADGFVLLLECTSCREEGVPVACGRRGRISSICEKCKSEAKRRATPAQGQKKRRRKYSAGQTLGQACGLPGCGEVAVTIVPEGGQWRRAQYCCKDHADEAKRANDRQWWGKEYREDGGRSLRGKQEKRWLRDYFQSHHGVNYLPCLGCGREEMTREVTPEEMGVHGTEDFRGWVMDRASRWPDFCQPCSEELTEDEAQAKRADHASWHPKALESLVEQKS